MTELRGIDLLKEIKAAIDAEPQRFNMCDWVISNPCYTSLCMAGWAGVLTGLEVNAIMSTFYKDDEPVDIKDWASEKLFGDVPFADLPKYQEIFFSSNEDALEWLEACISVNRVVEPFHGEKAWSEWLNRQTIYFYGEGNKVIVDIQNEWGSRWRDQFSSYYEAFNWAVNVLQNYPFDMSAVRAQNVMGTRYGVRPGSSTHDD